MLHLEMKLSINLFKCDGKLKAKPIITSQVKEQQKYPHLCVTQSFQQMMLKLAIIQTFF